MNRQFAEIQKTNEHMKTCSNSVTSRATGKFELDLKSVLPGIRWVEERDVNRKPNTLFWLFFSPFYILFSPSDPKYKQIF